MKQFLLSVVIIVLSINPVLSQTDGNPSYTPPTVIPPTPEVASLLKFSETPVSFNTGIPNISIPIASISGRDLSASVSISYHAGGHRVNEEASWVGLGWSLSAGGQVTRTVRGRPDDHPTWGYINTQYTMDKILEECSKGEVDRTVLCKAMIYANGYIQKENDSEPDEFNFSGMGMVSGRFMFDQRREQSPYGRVVLFEGRGNKVVPIFGELEGSISEGSMNGGDDKIIGWEITDTNGNLFKYAEGNKFLKSASFPIKNGSPELCSDCGSSESYVETWDLVSVESSNGDIITFEYTRPEVPGWAVRNEVNYSMGEEKIKLWQGGSNGPSDDNQDRREIETSLTETHRSFTRISKIKTSQGSVEFVASADDRLDTQSPKKALSSVLVKDNFGNLIQKINLKHGYFQSSASTSNAFFNTNVVALTSANIIDTFLKRMYLKEVEFEEIVNENETPDRYSYLLQYNTLVDLPDKNSYAQDHWGYYNGANNNQSLIPSKIGDLYLGHTSTREVNEDFTQACILKSITFPEGGKTIFKLENNSKGLIDPGNGLRTNIVKVDAIPSTQHSITPLSSNSEKYIFTQNVTIPNDAQSYMGNPQTTELSYDGFTNRCADSDEFYDYNQDSAICDRMFFRIYEQNSSTPIVTKSIWQAGNIVVNKGGTYRVEIEITMTNDDYDFNENSTYVELRYRQNIDIMPYEDYLGGLRVSNVKNYDHTGELLSHKSYIYENGYSSSKPTYLRVSNIVTTDQMGVGTQLDRIHQTIEMVSQSWIPLITTQAKYQGYEVVKEVIHEVENRSDYSNSGINEDILEEQVVKRTYMKQLGYTPVFIGAPYEPMIDRNNLAIQQTGNKQMLKNKYLIRSFRPTDFIWGHKASVILKLEDFRSTWLSSGYGFIGASSIDNQIQCGQYSSCKVTGSLYQITPYVNLVSEQTIEENEGQNKQTTVTQTYYESIPNHYSPTKTIVTGSDGKTTEKRMFYPYESADHTLLGENKINTMLKSSLIKEGVIINVSKNTYAISNGNYLPKAVKVKKMYVPITSDIQSEIEPEERLIYHSYYPNGKPREVSKKDGTHIVYIWGYNGSLPIAKIENATYKDIASYVANIENLSNQDDDRTMGGSGKEGALRTALNNLRNIPALSQSLVTTLTYDPLIGTTSVTDFRGNTIYYDYDGFNRLILSRDKEGNILKHNSYHYKTN